MPTIQDLGQLVKKKYPGSYDDLSDIDVGQRVQAKYPGAYDDFTPIQQGSSNDTGLLKDTTFSSNPLVKIGQFLGMGPLGESIGRGLFRGTSESQDLNRLVQSGQVPSRESILGQAPTAGQAAGSALQIGTLLAPGVGTAATLGGKALQFGTLGALAGAGRGLEEQQGLGDVLKNAAIGGTIGAATPVAIEGAAKGIQYLFGQTATGGLPERLTSQVFKETDEQALAKAYALANGKAPPPTLAAEALKEQIKGNPVNAAAYSITKLGDLEKQLQSTVSDQTVELTNKRGYIQALKTIKDVYEEHSFGTQPKVISNADKLIEALKPKGEVRADTVLELKRFLDNARAPSSFWTDNTLGPKQAGLKALADGARTALKSSVEGSADILAQESKFINFRDSLIKTAVKSQNARVLSLVDAVLGSAGFGLSGPLGSLGLETAYRALQSPTGVLNIANLINQAGQKGANIINKTVPAGTQGLIEKVGATQIPRLFGF